MPTLLGNAHTHRHTHWWTHTYLAHIRTGTHTVSPTCHSHTVTHMQRLAAEAYFVSWPHSWLSLFRFRLPAHFTLPSPPAPPATHTAPHSTLLSAAFFLSLPPPLSPSLLALLDPLPNAQMLSSFAFSAKYSRLQLLFLPLSLLFSFLLFLLLLIYFFSLTPLVISYCSYFSFFFRPPFCTFDFASISASHNVHRPQAIFIAIFIGGLIE